MELYKKVNILENKKALIWLNVASIFLAIIFILLFGALGLKIRDNIYSYEYGFTGLLLFLASYFALIVIHELIHGLFFKIYEPEGKVRFGFKNFMAYASSEGNVYSKGQFAVIILAPFVLISTGLTLIFAFGWLNFFAYSLITGLHAASCVGDFYYIILLIRAPKNVMIEDTSVGMSIYLQKENE